MQVSDAEGASAALEEEAAITRSAVVLSAAEATLRRLQRLQKQKVRCTLPAWLVGGLACSCF